MTLTHADDPTARQAVNRAFLAIEAGTSCVGDEDADGPAAEGVDEVQSEDAASGAPAPEAVAAMPGQVPPDTGPPRPPGGRRLAAEPMSVGLAPQGDV